MPASGGGCASAVFLRVHDPGKRFWEFFTANIRNPNTQCAERIGEGLEIGHGGAREGLRCPAAEAGDVGAVGALGVDGAAVEPDGDQLIVGMGLGGVGSAIPVDTGEMLSRKKDNIPYRSFKKLVFCAGAH